MGQSKDRQTYNNLGKNTGIIKRKSFNVKPSFYAFRVESSLHLSTFLPPTVNHLSLFKNLRHKQNFHQYLYDLIEVSYYNTTIV